MEYASGVTGSGVELSLVLRWVLNGQLQYFTGCHMLFINLLTWNCLLVCSTFTELQDTFLLAMADTCAEAAR